jgi:hypothetical protein
VSSTPLDVTVAWRAVDGAVSYTVEQALSLNGPWTMLPPPKGTQIQVRSYAGIGNGYSGGNLVYYRVTAVPSLGEPGITVVPRVTPSINAPVGVQVREDGADLWVSWAPAAHATGYVVTLAPGAQLAPTHQLEVGTQPTEARLVNVASPNMPRTVWVAVNTRYGTALTAAAPIQLTIPAVQQCWPPSSMPGTPPLVTVLPAPTSVSFSAPSAVQAQSTARVERTPMGGQVWQIIGCRSGVIADASLAPGTQYQYRVTEVWPNGQVGQATMVASTSAPFDIPAPTAAVSDCTATGCQVTLKWLDYAGTDGVRIESSYGLSRIYATNWTGKAWTGPTSGSPPTRIDPSLSVFLPKGTYSFAVTTLYRPMRPSSRPPGQVTVVVP